MSFLKSTCLAAAVLATAGIAAADTLKVSHIRPQGATIDNELRAFAETLSGATGWLAGAEPVPGLGAGRLYLGAGTHLGRGHRHGRAACRHRCGPPHADLGLPYVAANWAEARKIYGPGGAIHGAMKDLYAKQDITMLAAYPVYFGGIALNTDAVNPGDPTATKGVKVRVPGIKSFQLTADALGYISLADPLLGSVYRGADRCG